MPLESIFWKRNLFGQFLVEIIPLENYTAEQIFNFPFAIRFRRQHFPFNYFPIKLIPIKSILIKYDSNKIFFETELFPIIYGFDKIFFYIL